MSCVTGFKTSKGPEATHIAEKKAKNIAERLDVSVVR